MMDVKTLFVLRNVNIIQISYLKFQKDEEEEKSESEKKDPKNSSVDELEKEIDSLIHKDSPDKEKKKIKEIGRLFNKLYLNSSSKYYLTF